MADCIGTGFPQFPCVLVQIQYSIGENGCGHILRGGGGVTLVVRKKVTREMEGKEEKRGKRWGICIKASSHTRGNKNLKIKKYSSTRNPFLLKEKKEKTGRQVLKNVY